MNDERQRSEDKAGYEKILGEWERMGFIRPDWSIYWNGGEGCWTIEFETSRKIYVLTEAEMDCYIVGAADMTEFLRQVR